MVRNFFRLSAALFMICATLCLFSCEGKEKKETTEEGLSTESGDSVTESFFDVSDFDLMYFSNGKFNFYRLSDSATSTYEGENGLIMNYCLQPNTLVLYYSVCAKDSTVDVKKIDFSQVNPEPEDVVNFGIKYNQCISETYEGYSPLLVNKDASMVVLLYDFSWDSYGFCMAKTYLPKTGKFQNGSDWDKFYSDNDQDNKYGDYSFTTRPGDADPDDPDTDPGLYLVCMNEKTLDMQFLSDKIDFFSMSGGNNWPEDFDVRSLSPDKKYALFTATLEWGDYPHGPYCIASLDGEYQLALEGTDIPQMNAIDWLDNGSLLYVGCEPRPTTDPNYNEYNKTRLCINIVNPKDKQTPEVLIHDASDFIIMKSGK